MCFALSLASILLLTVHGNLGAVWVGPEQHHGGATYFWRNRTVRRLVSGLFLSHNTTHQHWVDERLPCVGDNVTVTPEVSQG